MRPLTLFLVQRSSERSLENWNAILLEIYSFSDQMQLIFLSNATFRCEIISTFRLRILRNSENLPILTKILKRSNFIIPEQFVAIVHLQIYHDMITVMTKSYLSWKSIMKIDKAAIKSKWISFYLYSIFSSQFNRMLLVINLQIFLEKVASSPSIEMFFRFNPSNRKIS